MVEEASKKRDPKLLSIAVAGIAVHAAKSEKELALWRSLKPSVEAAEKIIADSGVGAAASGATIEGHLHERTLIGWRDAFWRLTGQRLLCFKTRRGGAPDEAIDVALASVKPKSISSMNPVERAQFEITLPGRKPRIFLLRASCVAEMEAWVSAIKRAAASPSAAEEEPTITPRAASGDTRPIATLRAIGLWTEECEDCASTLPPSAINLALGSLLCSKCAAAHEALKLAPPGKIKLIADIAEWGDPILLQFLRGRGNDANWRFFEHKLFDSSNRPSASADAAARQAFCESKYLKKLWMPETTLPAADLGRLLLAAAARDPAPPLDTVASMICAGASVNYVEDFTFQRPIHKCAIAGNLIVLELLVQNGADVDPADSRGWLPVHYAAFHNRPRCLERLIAHGAKLVADPTGVTPLIAAMWNGAVECAQILSGKRPRLRPLTLQDVEANAVREVQHDCLAAPIVASPPKDLNSPRKPVAQTLAIIKRTKSMANFGKLAMPPLPRSTPKDRRPSNARERSVSRSTKSSTAAIIQFPASFHGPVPQRRHSVSKLAIQPSLSKVKLSASSAITEAPPLEVPIAIQDLPAQVRVIEEPAEVSVQQQDLTIPLELEVEVAPATTVAEFVEALELPIEVDAKATVSSVPSSPVPAPAPPAVAAPTAATTCQVPPNVLQDAARDMASPESVFISASREWGKRNVTDIRHGVASVVESIHRTTSPDEGFVLVTLLRKVLRELEPAQKKLGISIPVITPPANASRLQSIAFLSDVVAKLVEDILSAAMTAIETSKTQQAASAFLTGIEASLEILRRAGRVRGSEVNKASKDFASLV